MWRQIYICNGQKALYSGSPRSDFSKEMKNNSFALGTGISASIYIWPILLPDQECYLKLDRLIRAQCKSRVQSNVCIPLSSYVSRKTIPTPSLIQMYCDLSRPSL
ncbi:uncharacterized protein DEA37_0012091 [Paragonimus westermani]|uniref:Uncharacterized protein n=1 Tax=Paragonimus westermani TaxID=34504 RepID=A0A5J4NFR2_9TREM|nr:uncharacterized protein DEA37_0012091 [Paragonimus westermani]